MSSLSAAPASSLASARIVPGPRTTPTGTRAAARHGQPPSPRPRPPGRPCTSPGGIDRGSRWCGFRQSGRAQYTDPARNSQRSCTRWQSGQTTASCETSCGPSASPMPQGNSPAGPAPAADGVVRRIRVMGTPTVAALVLAGLTAAIVTAVP